MKRTPLKRKTRLKAGKPLTRTAKLKPRSTTKKQPPGKDVAYRRWVASHFCLLAGRVECGFYAERRKIEACHVKTWASSRVNHRNLWPGCPKHHDEQEGHTADFERRYSINLAEIAVALDAQYVRQATEAR